VDSAQGLFILALSLGVPDEGSFCPCVKRLSHTQSTKNSKDLFLDHVGPHGGPCPDPHLSSALGPSTDWGEIRRNRMNLRPGTSVALPLSASFALRRSSVRRGRSTSSFPPPRFFGQKLGPHGPRLKMTGAWVRNGNLWSAGFLASCRLYSCRLFFATDEVSAVTLCVYTYTVPYI